MYLKLERKQELTTVKISELFMLIEWYKIPKCLLTAFKSQYINLNYFIFFNNIFGVKVYLIYFDFIVDDQVEDKNKLIKCERDRNCQLGNVKRRYNTLF